jgi:hypothetical protein
MGAITSPTLKADSMSPRASPTVISARPGRVYVDDVAAGLLLDVGDSSADQPDGGVDVDP